MSTILPDSPKYYNDNFMPCLFDDLRSGFTFTNAGLSIRTEIWEIPRGTATIVPLNVISLKTKGKQNGAVALPLKRRGKSNGFDRDGPIISHVDYDEYRFLGMQEILIYDEVNKWLSMPNAPYKLPKAYIIHLNFPEGIRVHQVQTYTRSSEVNEPTPHKSATAHQRPTR